jgi:hypothetical protein
MSIKLAEKEQKPMDKSIGVRSGKQAARLLRTAGILSSLADEEARQGMEFYFPEEPENRRKWALRVWERRSGPGNGERRLSLSRGIDRALSPDS